MANALTTRQADIQMMLAAEVHLGTKNCDLQMEGYVFKRRPDVVEEAKAKEQEEEEAKEKEQEEEEEVAVLKDYLADWCDRWSFTIPDVPWSAGGWTRADAPAGADGWVSASAHVLTGDAAAFVWE